VTKSYAVSEIQRCFKDPYLDYGVNLHFGNSNVDLDDPHQVEQLQSVFHAAYTRCGYSRSHEAIHDSQPTLRVKGG
jgi:hypothetical protein